MMMKIDFSKIEEMLRSSKDFSLTETQYQKLTGRPIPTDNTYLVSRSALARFAQDHGYRIKLQEKTISFEELVKRR